MKKRGTKDKLWSGRFDRPTDALVERFTESVSFDARLYHHDIRGSIAHVRMLAKIGILKDTEMKKIVTGLRRIEKEIESGDFTFDPALEDVHMNIESRLIERLGDTGAKLHTARSRNDQIAVDLRMWLKDTVDAIAAGLTELQSAFLKAAAKTADVVFPGYTHLQIAQPVLFAHHLLAYIEMFQRDKERLRDVYKRGDELPLGSGAISGTSIPVDREFVARELGFARISRNSMDAVSDRDFLLEYLAALTIMGIHFSRFSEELVLWSSTEFGYIDIDDAFCTGSSMLPQKKNPDVAELIRGKAGHFIGALVSLATLMKGLPLSYNRDMQEDKLPVFRGTDFALSIIGILTPLVASISVRKERASSVVAESGGQAIDIAEYLVKKGVPFREAHFVVGRIVRDAEKKGVALSEMSAVQLRSFSKKFEDDVSRVMDPLRSPDRKLSAGSTSPKMVRQQIGYWKRKLRRESS